MSITCKRYNIKTVIKHCNVEMVVKNKFKNFSLKIILKVDRQTLAYKSHLSVVTLILS